MSNSGFRELCEAQPPHMDTIRNMYPIVKSMLDEICEAAKLPMIVRWR